MPLSLMILQSLINGILSGGVYALVAVGITIVFGVMKMINFAMGEFLMLGMYMTYVGYCLTGFQSYGNIVFVIIMMAIIAFVCFRLSIKPVLGQGNTPFILVTVGLSTFLQNLAQLIFGVNPVQVPSSISSFTFTFGGLAMSAPRVVAFFAAIALVVLVNMLLKKTVLGRAMRATSEKPEVAKILGVHTEAIFTASFILGIVIAGVAGLLITPIYYCLPSIGSSFKVVALMIVVLGGLGDIKGAFIGGLMVGVVEALIGTFVAAELGPVGIFVLFLLVLYLKPQGLFGRSERKG